MFRKLSRICPKDIRHDTKTASVCEPRETNCRSMSGQASEVHLKAWNSEVDDWFPSKCPTMSDEHRTARKIYYRGKTRYYDGDTSKLNETCKVMTAPEGKLSCHPRTTCDSQTKPVSRRVCDSEHCEAGAEQRQSVAVASADSCSRVCHKIHGRWKLDIRVQEMPNQDA